MLLGNRLILAIVLRQKSNAKDLNQNTEMK